MGRTAHRGKGEQPGRAPPRTLRCGRSSPIAAPGSRKAGCWEGAPDPFVLRTAVGRGLSEWEAAFERSGKNVGASVPGRTGHAQAPQDGCGREAGR